MHITFDNHDLADVRKATQAYNQAPEVKSGSPVFAAEISSAIPDNKTYETRKMGINEFRDKIKDVDVAVNQDYMTVMAHTVSSEDYQRMTEDGVNPMDCEVKDTVTIMDRIKLDVALGGGEIKGFTDTLDSETVEAMTGTGLSTSVKNALKEGGLDIEEFDVTVDNDTIKNSIEAFNEISDVKEMTDGMKRFFVGTGKELTVNNLYLAKHSAESVTVKESTQGSAYFATDLQGYLAKRGDFGSTDELKAEVKDLLGRIGIPADSENIENGTWLVENSFCINNETMERLTEVNQISLPVSKEEFVKLAAIAVSEGRKPVDALVTKTENIYNEAVRLTRVMEETRLKMTSEANLVLLKSDYHIDTKDLEEYVEALKKAESTPEYKELRAIGEVKETVAEIKAFPAAMIAYLSSRPSDSLSSRPNDSLSSRPNGVSGEISSADINDLTLTGIKELGAPIKQKYDLAFETYEQVGTEVRRDLGDSIRKAFRNVDDILSETGMDVTPENRRAVRILGYNSMPISKESVEKIKEADMKLTGVLNRITPEDTLKLIRSGKSPIEMSVKELNEYLDSKENTTKEEIEKYSKFLYKLERNNEITPEERKQYIEVYRFFHQLEKGDLAAIGSVLNAGAELTLKNLKTAIKTAKNTRMDVKIDDSFGLLVSDIRSELSPEKIHAIEFSDETSLDTLYKNLAETDVTKEYDEAWNKEQLREMKEALRAPEEAVTELIENRVPVTAENIRAAFGLMKRRGSFINDDISEEAKESIDILPEKFEDKESTVEAYSEMIAKTQDSLYENAMNADAYLDVRALKLAFAGMSLARRYSESETYEVPMELDGEQTLINLKVVHNPDEEANVVISSETDAYGRISARLYMKNESISGYISCNLKDTVTKMERVADILSSDVKVVYSLNSDTDVTLSEIPMRRNDDAVETKDLYKVARKFLMALKEA